jgi:glycosyltransferase involved in cell wall biosynthesis
MLRAKIVLKLFLKCKIFMKSAIKNQNPLVTVYMPTHNRRDLLERAVNSVLEQKYINIELIVVDDGSVDSTLEYLKSISDNRVRVLSVPVAKGACNARNQAIYEARGDLITGLDDDDYFLQDHIQEYINAWCSSAPNVVAIYSNLMRHTGGGLKRAYPKIDRCQASDLIYGNWPGNQVFTKTEYLRKIFGFNVHLPAWQDFDCWYRLLKVNGGVAVRKDSYTYVLDISHAHERISGGNSEKIFAAWSLFCESNDIGEKKREVLKLSTVRYSRCRPSIRALFYKVTTFPRWHNFRHALVIVYFGFFSRFQR